MHAWTVDCRGSGDCVTDAFCALKMNELLSPSVSHRVRFWPWTGSETRLIEFVKTPKSCICVQSKLIALTALKLWAVTRHRKLKVTAGTVISFLAILVNDQQQELVYRICVSECTAGPPFPPESFDRVLLDAPCSGLGQRPNMGSTWSLKEICSYKPLQRKLLHSVGFTTHR